MPALHKLQQDLIRCILQDGDAGALPLKRKERLQIYKNNTAFILRDLLKDVFPVTTKLLGEGFMNHAAQAFIAHLPPESGDMNGYGARFADFLAHLPALNQYPYVPDTARLEWLAHESYLSPRLPAMTAQDLAAVKDPVNMRLRLQPHVQILQSAWPVDTLWSAIGEQGDALKDFTMEARDTCCALFRDGQRIAVWSVTIGGYRFMEHLQTIDASFAFAAEAAMAAEPELSLDRLLAALIQQELLVKE